MLAQALRIQETPSVSTRDQVIAFLQDKQMLLDYMTEHIPAEEPDVKGAEELSG